MPYGNLSDEELAVSAGRGDGGAFDELAERHMPRTYARHRRAVFSDADAEDLTQQTWAKVHQKIHQYDGRGSFQAWLLAIEFRTRIDSWRSRPHEVSLPPDGSVEEGIPSLPPILVDPATSMSPESLSDAKIEEVLQHCADSCPLKRRREPINVCQKRCEIIFYYCFAPEDFDENELAAILGVPAGNVSACYQECKRRFKEYFEL